MLGHKASVAEYALKGNWPSESLGGLAAILTA
jgi:hypothetical protein